MFGTVTENALGFLAVGMETMLCSVLSPFSPLTSHRCQTVPAELLLPQPMSGGTGEGRKEKALEHAVPFQLPSSPVLCTN